MVDGTWYLAIKGDYTGRVQARSCWIRILLQLLRAAFQDGCCFMHGSGQQQHLVPRCRGCLCHVRTFLSARWQKLCSLCGCSGVAAASIVRAVAFHHIVGHLNVIFARHIFERRTPTYPMQIWVCVDVLVFFLWGCGLNRPVQGTPYGFIGVSSLVDVAALAPPV